MVKIPLDLAPEAVLPILTGLRDRLAPEVGGVGHDQQTEFVRPVKFAWDLHLDVDPVAVQAELLREQDLVLHELVAGEGVEAFRMVALVKAKLQINRLVVESHVFIVGSREFHGSDLPLAEVAVHGIILDRSLDLVKEGIFQVPKVLILDRDHERSLVLAADVRGESLLAAGLELEFESLTLGGRGGEGDIHLDRRVVYVRAEMEGADVVLSPGLKINCLPDAPGVAVSLLAIKMGIILGVIRLDDQGLVLPEGHVLKLALKRCVAPLMAANLLAVQPHLGVPVGGSDNEIDPLALP